MSGAVAGAGPAAATAPAAASEGATVRALRLALGAGGLVVIGGGVASLVGTPLPALVSIAVFLLGGVVAHDALLAPATLAGGAGARRLLPRGWLAPVVVAAVLLGTLTVVAMPVLVGVNESPDNATVVDRPYRATWLVLAAATVVAVVVAGAVRSARSRRAAPDAATSPGVAGAPHGGTAVTARPRRTGRAPLTLVSTVVVVVVSGLRAVRPRRTRRPDRPRGPHRGPGPGHRP